MPLRGFSPDEGTLEESGETVSPFVVEDMPASIRTAAEIVLFSWGGCSLDEGTAEKCGEFGPSFREDLPASVRTPAGVASLLLSVCGLTSTLPGCTNTEA